MRALPCAALFAAVLLFAAPASGADGKRQIIVDLERAGDPIDRMFNFSIGSDYAGTMLRQDSLDQLQYAKAELGFRYIRFHAIFHDDLGTIRRINGQTVYNWSKIDLLFDQLLAMDVKPFVELGFTPEAMATSPQTIFYWKGNTSHPEPKAWAALVDAFVRHLIERYGKDEILKWYFEVWNEPNLAMFWERADQKAYFDLYASSARTIKAIDPRLKVGGPSTAGAAWVPEFLDFAQQDKVPVDFVTTHSYGVDGGFLDEAGQDDTKLSTNPDAVSGEVYRVRNEISVSAFPTLPMFFTEWSASYSPRDPVHDSYISAPYILTKLKAVRGHAQGMSYWTYSDLFEESGPPPTPFHGGFGLMNREGIRKPAYFAFKYLNQLEGREIKLDDPEALAATEKGRTSIVFWNWQQPEQKNSNRPFFTKLRPAPAIRNAALLIKGLAKGQYRVTLRRTGYRANDPQTRYIEMGSPQTLSPDQLAELQSLSQDKPEVDRIVRIGSDGRYQLQVSQRQNDALLLQLDPVR